MAKKNFTDLVNHLGTILTTLITKNKHDSSNQAILESVVFKEAETLLLTASVTTVELDYSIKNNIKLDATVLGLQTITLTTIGLGAVETCYLELTKTATQEIIFDFDIVDLSSQIKAGTLFRFSIQNNNGVTRITEFAEFLTGKFEDGTDPLDAVYLDGNVGIGTEDTEGNKLKVLGNTKLEGYVRIFSDNERVASFRTKAYNSTDATGSVKIVLGFEDHDLDAIQLVKKDTNASALQLYSETGFNTEEFGLSIFKGIVTLANVITGEVNSDGTRSLWGGINRVGPISNEVGTAYPFWSQSVVTGAYDFYHNLGNNNYTVSLTAAYTELTVGYTKHPNYVRINFKSLGNIAVNTAFCCQITKTI